MRAALLATCVLLLASCGGAAPTLEPRTAMSNGVTYVMPTGWTVFPIGELRAQVQSVIDSGASGDIGTSYVRLVQLIDQKVLVGAALAAPTGSRAAILMFELPSASTMDGTVDAALGLIPRLASETITSRTAVDVPVGRAVVITSSSEPVGGTPTDSVEYVVDLGNGRALYLDGAEPNGERTLPAIMEKLVSSLAKP